MTQKTQIKLTNKHYFWLIFIFGALIRLYKFPEVLTGLNCDEAFSLYESLNLLKHGTDSWGYSNPVYLTAWGSGMNVLQSVLMMPFVALFGPTKLAARLPIMICYIATLPAFYHLLKKYKDERFALAGMFLLALSPWHFTMSKFALESNLAVPMFLFAGLFFIKGIENNKWYILSAFFFGLSLYAYATMWIVVPLVLLICFVYLLYQKKLKFNKEIVIAVGLLFILALPLILFLLVNADIIPEVRGLISIPKLALMRAAEISPSNIAENVKLYIEMMTTGISPWQSFYGHGAYLFVGLMILVIGLTILVIKNIKKDALPKERLFLLIYIVLTIYGLCIFGLNENKINFLHIPNIILITYGLEYLLNKTEKVNKNLCIIPPLLVLGTFTISSNVYFNTINEIIGAPHLSAEGVAEALKFSEEKGNIIYFDDILANKFSWVLLNLEITPEEFKNDVVLVNNENLGGWYKLDSLYHEGNMLIGLGSDGINKVDTKAVYLLGDCCDGTVLDDAGADKKTFGTFTVYWFKN